MQPHVRTGLIFVGACVALGGLAFIVVDLGRTDESSQSENAEPYAMSTDLAQYEADSDGLGCEVGQVTVSLPSNADGILEVLTPLPDTDALASVALSVAHGEACLSRARLDESLAEAGPQAQRIEIALTFDPRGSRSRFRSLLDFLPDIDGEASSIAIPNDLVFGRATWGRKSLGDNLAVQWLSTNQALSLGIPEIEYDAPTLSEQASAYEVCLDNSGGVTLSMMDCMGDENERLDGILNATYQRRMNGMSLEKKSKLRQLQRAWINDRENECQAEAAPEEGGSLAGVIYAGCFVEQTQRRILWLRNYGAE